MPRPNYGPQAQIRARRLFNLLIAFANGDMGDRRGQPASLNHSFRSHIKAEWKTERKLVVRTKIRHLIRLSSLDSSEQALTSAQIRESLKQWDDYLDILDDNRTTRRGSDIWHFTLTLWHPRNQLEANLKTFDHEWQSKRPQRSPQHATQTSELEPDPPPTIERSPCRDWGEANDVSLFYGRIPEQAKLRTWIVDDCCRFICLLGIGGVG